MCGISILIRKNRTTGSDVIKRMNTVITHRGPDGEGVQYFSKSGSELADGPWQLAFGHRRLSIIDLTETGSQPMSFDDGRVWITYNGECYNYIELRDELTCKGYRFTSSSDTEVILAAYKEWGTNCFEKMRGMWGLGIYDLNQKELIVCRDRLGIKPLYYYEDQDNILYFSEIKQVIRTGLATSKVNPSAVKYYFDSGFENSRGSFFENIHQIEPGTFLRISLDNAEITNRVVSYWNPERFEARSQCRQDSVEQFKEAFCESIKIHLRSDVSIGCQLSGGLDSSSIIMAMSYLLKDSSNINTFSSVYPGYERSEDFFIRSILNKINASAHFSTPEPVDFINDLQAFVAAHDEPVGSFAQYASYRLAKLTHENSIKVVFNGQGGDEILGGYWQIYYAYMFNMLKKGEILNLIKHMVGVILPGGNSDFFQQFNFIFKRYVNRIKATNHSKIKLHLDVPENESYITGYMNLNSQEKRVFNIREFILPRLLKWDDRNLMAFSIEGRYPLLDHILIEACLQMPVEHMYDRGWTKYPLREALKDYLPQEIYNRKSKWAYEFPKEKWMRDDLKPLINAIINDKSSTTFDIIDHADTIHHVKEFMNGNDEEWQTVYRLINFDAWIKQYNICN
jgi:asparagine synthase (glutamine-hydrolysing)